jgi:serine/threonine-protein kinase
MKHWNDCELPDNALFPDNYKITEVIRESASSILLLAHDSIINNQVVIKCFKSEIKKTYLREINAVFDLQHPNLVRCLNTFHRTDGLACIVYEYLAGGSLTNLLDTKTPLPLQTIVACLRDILNALIYLNASNRIHCDIKPDNILLRPKAGGRVDYVLIDLGAACFLREAQEGRHVTGTPAYIAPERIKNKFFFNSDLYSLGVIAFEMCTGTRPFTGTVDEITKANLSDIPSLEAIKSLNYAILLIIY